VRLRTGRAELARWLERALAPEAAREVPRTETTIRRAGASLELRVRAADAGAMRAALNTYLGWLALSLATVGAAGERPRSGTGDAPGEALISRPP
jgi:KEOPS complex subunit Pcc1